MGGRAVENMTLDQLEIVGTWMARDTHTHTHTPRLKFHIVSHRKCALLREVALKSNGPADGGSEPHIYKVE